MATKETKPATEPITDHCEYLQRRLAGIQAAVVKLEAVPGINETPWGKGQLRYFRHEIATLERALQDSQHGKTA